MCVCMEAEEVITLYKGLSTELFIVAMFIVLKKIKQPTCSTIAVGETNYISFSYMMK